MIFPFVFDFLREPIQRNELLSIGGSRSSRSLSIVHQVRLIICHWQWEASTGNHVSLSLSVLAFGRLLQLHRDTVTNRRRTLSHLMPSTRLPPDYLVASEAAARSFYFRNGGHRQPLTGIYVVRDIKNEATCYPFEILRTMHRSSKLIQNRTTERVLKLSRNIMISVDLVL